MVTDNEFSPQSPIITKAQILERIDLTTYRASLPNGKSIHIHTANHSPSDHAFQNGDLVIVELKPYDFSRGRINMQQSSTSHLLR
jgi:translation initiation factor IF-1